MSHCIINSPLGTVKIDFLSNPVVNKIINHMVDILPHTELNLRHKVYRPADYTAPAHIVEPYIKQLEDVVNQLNSMGTHFPLTVDYDVLIARDLQAQNLLNQLHRAFTTAQTCVSESRDIRWSFDSTDTFAVGNLEQFLSLIHQINNLVHIIEIFINTDNRKSSVDCHRHCVDFKLNEKVSTGIPRNIWTNFEPEDYEYFSDSNEHDVWLGLDILGKDYLEAYFTHDRADAFDVRLPQGYLGWFSIATSEIQRGDILRDSGFRDWLSSYGVEYTPAMCSIPLGNVVEGKHLLTEREFLKLASKDITISVVE